MNTLLTILQVAASLSINLNISWSDSAMLQCPSWYDAGLIVSVCQTSDKTANVFVTYGKE